MDVVGRCRSAFKLLEMDARFQLLQPGMSVVDCGAAPGSWTQVSVAKVNADGKDPAKRKGRVVAIDRLPIYPIEGATILSSCDFTLPQSQERLLECVGGGVDVVLSDMAPNATGIKTMDHETIVKLAYAVARFTFGVGKVGSCLLVKLWEGSETCRLEKDLSNFYKSVKRVKPPSSRSDSAEIFILAQHFLGTKKS